MHPIRVFISYRRGDGAGSAGRINDILKDSFQLFFDVDSIKIGQRFHEKINKAIDSSDFLLCILGNNAEKEFATRLSSFDYVVAELEYANLKGVQIIPVLVEGAEMPNVASLPQSIHFITEINASVVRHTTFLSDAICLQKSLIEKKFPIPRLTSHPPNTSPASKWKESDLLVLSSHLQQKEWDMANRETARLLLEIAGRLNEGWPRARDVASLSCSVLFTIDAKWIKYSGGQYGFTPQLQLITDMNLDIDSSRHFSIFSSKVNWKSGARYSFEGLEGSYASYPTPIVINECPISVMRSSFQSLISRIRSCRSGDGF